MKRLIAASIEVLVEQLYMIFILIFMLDFNILGKPMES